MVDSATMPVIQRSASQPATLMDPLTIRGAYRTLPSMVGLTFLEDCGRCRRELVSHAASRR